jgi:Asp-tRNA(Asn)/Glu-tRNA(Gln) amidotransferase A subunit family amidase
MRAGSGCSRRTLRGVLPRSSGSPPVSPVCSSAVIDDARSNPRTLSPANMMFANYFGLPAISVPRGFDRNGLPIGLQIVGKPWDDVDVLRLGHQYQMLDAAHQKTPIP